MVEITSTAALGAPTGTAADTLGRWVPLRGRLGNRLLLGGTFVYIFLPLTAVLLYGFATSWTNHALPDGYTLRHWQKALGDERFRLVLLRSLGLAAGTSLLDLFLVTPAVYWQHVRNPGIRPVIELLAAIPFSLPFAVIAFGLLAITGAWAPWLQGTLWLLLPIHAAVAFSFVYWAIDGSMAAANVKNLCEAATTCGAGVGTTLRRVILPNIGPGLASGVILSFGASFNEIALVQILVGNRFETVQLYMLNMLKSSDADFNILAVMASIGILVSLLLSIASVILCGGGISASSSSGKEPPGP